MKELILSVILCLCFAVNVFAQEKCDYSFTGKIEAKIKEVGTMPDGTVLVDMYIVDKSGNILNGSVCQYNGNSLILRWNVRNGKQDGPGKAWHENGKLKWECTYKNGVPDGIMKYYFENGKLDKIVIHKNGIVVSAECSNGYIWTNAEVAKWNGGNRDRDSVRNICK